MLVADAIAKVIGRPVDSSTAWRWRVHGLHGIHLQTTMVGGRRMTTADAVRRFLAAVNDAAEKAAKKRR